MSTDLAGVVIGMCALVGIQEFLLVQLPITLLAGSAGVWLIYVQHQFEDTYWARQGAWSFHGGALQGATHYDLPGVPRWFTADIGIHHVHHLASRIPSFRLREALADHAELRDVGRLTLPAHPCGRHRIGPVPGAPLAGRSVTPAAGGRSCPGTRSCRCTGPS